MFKIVWHFKDLKSGSENSIISFFLEFLIKDFEKAFGL